jgi:hypothetical protein
MSKAMAASLVTLPVATRLALRQFAAEHGLSIEEAAAAGVSGQGAPLSFRETGTPAPSRLVSEASRLALVVLGVGASSAPGRGPRSRKRGDRRGRDAKIAGVDNLSR